MQFLQMQQVLLLQRHKAGRALPMQHRAMQRQRLKGAPSIIQVPLPYREQTLLAAIRQRQALQARLPKTIQQLKAMQRQPHKGARFITQGQLMFRAVMLLFQITAQIMPQTIFILQTVQQCL